MKQNATVGGGVKMSSAKPNVKNPKEKKVSRYEVEKLRLKNPEWLVASVSGIEITDLIYVDGEYYGYRVVVRFEGNRKQINSIITRDWLRYMVKSNKSLFDKIAKCTTGSFAVLSYGNIRYTPAKGVTLGREDWGVVEGESPKGAESLNRETKVQKEKRMYDLSKLKPYVFSKGQIFERFLKKKIEMVIKAQVYPLKSVEWLKIEHLIEKRQYETLVLRINWGGREVYCIPSLIYALTDLDYRYIKGQIEAVFGKNLAPFMELNGKDFVPLGEQGAEAAFLGFFEGNSFLNLHIASRLNSGIEYSLDTVSRGMKHCAADVDTITKLFKVPSDLLFKYKQYVKLMLSNLENRPTVLAEYAVGSLCNHLDTILAGYSQSVIREHEGHTMVGDESTVRWSQQSNEGLYVYDDFIYKFHQMEKSHGSEVTKRL